MPRRPLRSGALVLRQGPASTSNQSISSAFNGNSVSPLSKSSESEFANSIASLTLDTPLVPLVPKKREPPKVIPFLTLPSELRIKIYEHFFDDDCPEDVIDLQPDNYKRFHKKLGIVRVCKQIHDEATHFFYSSRTFRIFPTYPGKYFKAKKVLLARMKPLQRQCMTSIELRLGPGWSAPPRGWIVNDALGLGDCSHVKKLTVFIECDPSDGVFKGFRRGEGFYEGFSRSLLSNVLEALPAVEIVEFDAWKSVSQTGAMMHALSDIVTKSGLQIQWGPHRGWTDADDVMDKKSMSLTRTGQSRGWQPRPSRSHQETSEMTRILSGVIH